MVLWEIALATAYFLGLKTTYRRVLHIQRRLVSPNSPRLRQFLHRLCSWIGGGNSRKQTEINMN